MCRRPIHLLLLASGARRSPLIYPASRVRSDGRPRRIRCYKMCSVDSGLSCWYATTQAASDDAPSQRRGWRGVLSFSFEVGMRQGRVTLPCKSLRGVRAPNTCPRLCHWILSIPTGSGLLGRTTDGSSIQRRTDRGPARPAGALLAYMVHLYCGRLGIIYDHFWCGWGPQPEQRQRVLSTCLLRYPDVFLLCPLANSRGIR